MMDEFLALATPLNIYCYVLAINLVAFMAFGIDKRLAEAQRRRIAEYFSPQRRQVT